MDEKKITIIILTYNEAHNIPALIENVQGLPAHIFVVDSYSTDETINLLANNEITCIQHPFINYSEQRNWAQANNPFQTEWVLHIDADERLRPELKDWLCKSFDPDVKAIDGYMFGRKALFMNKWIKLHYNYHLRLYRSSKGKCETKAYDQHFVVMGNAAVIKKRDIESYVCDNLNQFIQGHNKWAYLEAIDILRKKEKGEVHSYAWGSPIQKKRWLKDIFFLNAPLFLRSFLYFLYRYVILLGFLDRTQSFSLYVL